MNEFHVRIFYIIEFYKKGKLTQVEGKKIIKNKVLLFEINMKLNK